MVPLTFRTVYDIIVNVVGRCTRFILWMCSVQTMGVSNHGNITEGRVGTMGVNTMQERGIQTQGGNGGLPQEFGVKAMRVNNLPEGKKPKTMEVWYFCRYLPPHRSLNANGRMDPSGDHLDDGGGGVTLVTADGENRRETEEVTVNGDVNAVNGDVDRDVNGDLDRDGERKVEGQKRGDFSLNGSVFSVGTDWDSLGDVSLDLLDSTSNITLESGTGMETSSVGGGGGSERGMSERGMSERGVSTSDANVEQQLVKIEEMVHEMKQVFVVAMEELGKIQEGDHQMQHRMQTHRDSVDRRLDSFKEQQKNQKSEILAELRKEIQADKENQPIGDMITALKSEVTTVSSRLQEVLGLQRGLQEKVQVLTSERNILLEELIRNGALSDHVRSLLQKNGNNSIQGGIEQSPPRMPEDAPEVNDEATASACKCLSLLQALEERCILPDLSDSSDDDIQSRQIPWQQQSTGSLQSRHGTIPGQMDAYHGDQSQDAVERQRVLQDTIDSERAYCAQLWTMLDGFLRPMQDGLYVSSRELSIIFPPYLSQMYDEHCRILHLLEDRLQHWNWGGLVGDVFGQMTDIQTGTLISLYKEYLSDFPAAVACIRRQIKQSRQFRALIKREDSQSGEIISLWTAPIRRIPQYSLLIQQLLKHTPRSHPDHYSLQSSLARLRSFVDQFSDDITHIVSNDKDRSGGQSFRSSPSGSSCETTGQPASARDSGIHSNGEDTIPQPTYVPHRSATPDWVEMTSGYPRNPSLESRFSARSQPDLTFGRYSTSQLPSQGSKGDYLYQDDNRQQMSDKLSHHRRYKLRKKGDRQGGHFRPGSSMSQSALPHEYGGTSYHLPQSRHRPASAIDFISRHDASQLRHTREHVHARPQSAMGNPSRRSHVVLGRPHLDNEMMSRSMPHNSQSTSSVHSVHTPHNHSYPAQRQYSPSPYHNHESPRILVNGQHRDLYTDAYTGHEAYPGHDTGDFGVYGDEEQNLVSAHTLKYSDNSQHYHDSGHQSYADDMDLAASLADSLNNHTDPGHRQKVIHNQDIRPSQDGRNSALGGESITTQKSDRSLHSSDLQINLGLVHDTASEAEESSRVPKPPSVITDSSDQPNSSFEECTRSESRNSEQKTEESSDMVTSQSQSPEHAVDNSGLGDSSRTITSSSIPIPVATDMTGNSAQHFTQLRNPRNNNNQPNNFENSVLSFDERILTNHQPVPPLTAERQTSERRARNTNRLSSPFPRTRPRDFTPDLHTLHDEAEQNPGKKDVKKKKDKTKRFNSMENLSKAQEDSKKTFKSSLKHFFGKKK